MREFIVGKNDKNQRLDRFLTKLCPNMPEAMLYKSLRKECVRVNSKHVKDGAFMLSEGDVLKLYLKDEFFERSVSEDIFKSLEPRVDIVYEDENILLAYKKPGMVVHADEQNSEPSLIDHIKAYLYRKGEYRPDEENTFTPSLCNRIDRNTEGMVIAAKNAESLRIMNQKIRDREIHKKYLCILTGIMKKKSGELSGFLFKDEKQKRVYVYNEPRKGAKTIITRYRILEEKNNLSLAEAELVTGRTHQIRAHFSSVGHPLLGDGKYGSNKTNKENNIFHQALCAYYLKFDFTTEAGLLSYLDKKEFKIENTMVEEKWKNE